MKKNNFPDEVAIAGVGELRREMVLWGNQESYF
jgi:hypothetical protein